MPLSSKAKKELIIAMGSKKDADRLEVLMDSNGPIDAKMLKRIEIMLCDKKRAAEMKADIESVSATSISLELRRDLEIALADDDQVADASDGPSSMETEIES